MSGTEDYQLSPAASTFKKEVFFSQSAVRVFFCEVFSFIFFLIAGYPSTSISEKFPMPSSIFALA